MAVFYYKLFIRSNIYIYTQAGVINKLILGWIGPDLGVKFLNTSPKKHQILIELYPDYSIGLDIWFSKIKAN